MVNVFGDREDGSIGPQGNPGRTGPQGPYGLRGSKGSKGNPGKDGIEEIYRWFPNMVVKQFREEEEEDCFLLANPKKDVKHSKGGEIVEWISRSNKKYNLVAERASKSIVELLDFQKSRYINDDCAGFSYNRPGSYGYVCVTFRFQGDHEQTILTNYDSTNPTQFNEISATNTEIYIWRQKDAKSTRVIIRLMCRDWSTLFIEWFSTKKQMYGNYVINDDEKTKGTFTFDQPGEHPSGIHVGSKVNNTQVLTGAEAGLRCIIRDVKKRNCKIR